MLPRQLLASLGEPLREAAHAATPSLSAGVVTPCPFDYPDGEVIARDAVNLFTFQVYLENGISDPTAEVVEHWLPAGRDSATPVTFRLRIPTSVAQDPGRLRNWLKTVVVGEPTVPQSPPR